MRARHAQRCGCAGALRAADEEKGRGAAGGGADGPGTEPGRGDTQRAAAGAPSMGPSHARGREAPPPQPAVVVSLLPEVVPHATQAMGAGGLEQPQPLMLGQQRAVLSEPSHASASEQGSDFSSSFAAVDACLRPPTMLEQLQLQAGAGEGVNSGAGGPQKGAGSQRAGAAGLAAPGATGLWEGGGGRPPPRLATAAAAALLAPSPSALQLAAGGGRALSVLQPLRPEAGPGNSPAASQPSPPIAPRAAAALTAGVGGALLQPQPMDVSPLLRGTGAYGSGAVLMDLVGEIDGLIRRIEASTTSTGPQALAASNSGKQQTQHRVLGSGGFGVVYKGEWRGLPVAIKVVLLQEGDTATRRQRLVREVALTATLSHPHIVPTYHYTASPVRQWAGGAEPHANPPSGPGGGDGGGGSSGALSEAGVVAHQLSIVMAYCDRGTLRDALKGDTFNRPWEGMGATGTGGAKAASASRNRGTGSAETYEDAAVVATRGPAAEGSGAGTTGSNPPPPGLPARRAVLPAQPQPQQQQQQQPQPQPQPRPLPGAAGGGTAPGDTLGRSQLPEAGLVLQACAAEPEVRPRVEAWADLRPVANQPLALVAALDVARGLAYLHACNVVHGDLSLQNILITSVEPRFPEAALAAAGAAAADVTAAAAAAGVAIIEVAMAAVGVTHPQPQKTAVDVRAVLAGAAKDLAHSSHKQLNEGEVTGPASAEVSFLPAAKSDFWAVPSSGAAEADAGDDVAAQPPPVRMAGVDGGGVGASLVGARCSQSGPDGRGGRPPISPHASAPSCTAFSGPTTADANTSTANTGTLWSMYRAHDTGGTGGGSGGTPVGIPSASFAGGGGAGRARTRLAQHVLLLPLLNQVFKISDFGLSVRLEGDETHRSNLYQGTPFFTAVEVLQSGQVAPAADIYSFGVCLWCLAHGVSLCQLRHLLPSVYHPLAPSLTANTSPDLPPPLRALIRRCLASDASRRPSAPSLVAELTDMLQAVGSAVYSLVCWWSYG
ncbi:Proto-oncogene serine/threonine-protein kinase mos [Tetrabaena socialis]|uniref:Proto-oncogene serine/threonine-protein kinase mos n=1 Tax=Tetrabaena socialis TaxID=47790 RepID=A0A2J8A0G1_9CHLO|nr:Proto-oncogene serine/threonine-protein kinase mos [Tetrabaena socialis]|eukprot:PNH06012.1 Proto-oncogene serine/threonine-protein kinase mos [Tetrabaena socialis]